MIDEAHQDLAIEYTLGSLPPAEVPAFEAALASDSDLREFVRSLHETSASLAHAAPELRPPPELRARILSSISGEMPARSTHRGFSAWVPWALAAGFALFAGVLWAERVQLQSEAFSLRLQTAELRERDALAQVRIATLSTKIDEYAKSAAVVVWDEEKQRGILKLAHVPHAASGHDYQLWVIDPKMPHPVSAGVVPVDENGLARISFHPDQRVETAGTFAITLERTGGVPLPAGPVVLAGN